MLCVERAASRLGDLWCLADLALNIWAVNHLIDHLTHQRPFGHHHLQGHFARDPLCDLGLTWMQNNMPACVSTSL